MINIELERFLGGLIPADVIATPQSKSKSKTQTGVGIIITRKPLHHHTTTPPPPHRVLHEFFSKFAQNGKLGSLGLPKVLQAKCLTATPPHRVLHEFFSQFSFNVES